MVWIAAQPLPVYDIKVLSHRIWPYPISLFAVFFDGGSTGGHVWVLCMDKAWKFWNGGRGTNNKAEILALWSGLWLAYNLQLQSVNIYGDEHLRRCKHCPWWNSGRFHYQLKGMQGWIFRIKYLLTKLNDLPLQHIYRENNHVLISYQRTLLPLLAVSMSFITLVPGCWQYPYPSLQWFTAVKRICCSVYLNTTGSFVLAVFGFVVVFWYFTVQSLQIKRAGS